MKRLFPLLLAVLLLFGCAAAPAETPATAETAGPQRYQAPFLTLFDTVTTIVGYAGSKADFTATAQELHDELLEYHQLYDIYNDYEGMTNLKTVNDRAGQGPVAVDRKILDLLLFSKELYAETGGRVNIAMGSVLSLWHDAREAGIENPEAAALPDDDALKEAAAHTDIGAIQIDEEAGTVYFTDPELRLDVGAIAKGYAAQRVCENAPEGLLISIGGNVCATGPKPDSGQPWVVGIEDPDDTSRYLHTLYVDNYAVVTSGDYQRYYTVDGVVYHHIIDPDTLYPARYWRAVTILCPDSGLADALSTALFTLPQAEGQALLDRFDAEALWVQSDGTLVYSPGFRDHIRV